MGPLGTLGQREVQRRDDHEEHGKLEGVEQAWLIDGRPCWLRASLRNSTRRRWSTYLSHESPMRDTLCPALFGSCVALRLAWS